MAVVSHYTSAMKIIKNAMQLLFLLLFLFHKAIIFTVRICCAPWPINWGGGDFCGHPLVEESEENCCIYIRNTESVTALASCFAIDKEEQNA